MRNVRSPAPIRTCRKKTGPLESSLISTATTRKTGASSTSPSVAADNVQQPLQQPRRPGEVRARQSDERHPLDRVELRVRSEHLEHPRDDVDLHVAVLHRANHSERLVVRVGRERDGHAVNRVLANESRQIVASSHELDTAVVSVAVATRAVVVVDEPDDAEPVLGVLRDLVGEQLCDAARPDDDDVLDVRAPAVAQSHGSRHGGAE